MRRRGINISKAAETPDYLFLIGGQSNAGDAPATGRVAYNLMPSYLAAPQGNVKRWNGSVFGTYTHPNATQWGWMNEFLFRAGESSNKAVHYYKYGAGGTQLASGGPYTQYNKATLKTNSLNAINAFKSQFPQGRVVFLWCQGYTDGLNETNSLAYGDNLSDWFEEVRAYWSQPNMLIMYDELSSNATGSTFRENIKAGQIANDGGINILIESDDCPYQDIAHYSDVGSIILGQRFNTTLQTL